MIDAVVAAWGAHHLLSQSGRRNDGWRRVFDAQRRADKAAEEAREAHLAYRRALREGHPSYIPHPGGKKCEVFVGMIDFRKLERQMGGGSERIALSYPRFRK